MDHLNKVIFRVIFGLCLGLCLPFALHGQLVQDYNPPPTQCCLPGAASRLADQLLDWNQLGRYHQDDLRLEAAPTVPGRVVFMGDSITDGWDLAKYFPGKPYVNRGISGQTTPQMVVRMHPDVIHLQPAAFILLAGTNDIAHNTGPETIEMVEDNIRAMSELAESHHIKIILCLLTPVSNYGKRKQTDSRPPADIVNLNHWIESYAPDVHAQVADYYAALVDDKGMLREGFSDDGLHPNARGYELLAPVAEAAIEAALKVRVATFVLTGIDIRRLTDRDAEAYWHLRSEALEREPESFGESAEEHRATTVESAAKRLATDPDDNFVLGAYRDGQLVGMAGFFRYQIAKARHKGKIWGVYVRPNCRGQGIGRALLHALLEKVQACPGIEQVSLTVIRGQKAARDLYCSLGFEPYGLEPHGLKIGERYFDNEHMALLIDRYSTRREPAQ